MQSLLYSQYQDLHPVATGTGYNWILEIKGIILVSSRKHTAKLCCTEKHHTHHHIRYARINHYGHTHTSSLLASVTTCATRYEGMVFSKLGVGFNRLLEQNWTQLKMPRMPPFLSEALPLTTLFVPFTVFLIGFVFCKLDVE